MEIELDRKTIVKKRPMTKTLMPSRMGSELVGIMEQDGEGGSDGDSAFEDSDEEEDFKSCKQRITTK